METLTLALLKTIKFTYGSYPVSVQVYQLLLIPIILFLLEVGYFWYLDKKNRHKKHFFLTLQFPVASQEDLLNHIARMETLFSSLHKLVSTNTDKLFLEVMKVENYITLVLGSNNQKLLEQAKAIFSQLQHAQLITTEHDLPETISPLYAKQVSTAKDYFPITKDERFFDGILHFLASLKPDEQAGMQLILRGVNKHEQIQGQINKLIQKAEQRKRMINQREEMLIQGYQEKQHGNIFKVKVNLFANNQTSLTNLLSIIHALNLKENVITSSSESKKNILQRFIAPETFLSPFSLIRKKEGVYLNAQELSYLIHPSIAIRGVYAPKQTKMFEATPAFLKKQDDNILIGTSETGDGKEQKVYFPLQNFARHLYIVGKTGRGKSTLLTSFISNLAKKKDTTAFVFDPHGDLLEDIIKTSDTQRLAYLNIANQNRVFTTNPLFCFRKTSYEKAAIRDALLDIIQNETQEQMGNFQSGVATYNRLKQILDIGIEFADAYYAYLIKQGIDEKRAEEIVNGRQLTLNDLPLLLEKELEYTGVLKTVFANSKSAVGMYIDKLLEKHMNQPMVIEAVQARLEQLLHTSIRLICEGNKFDLKNALDAKTIFLIPIPESVYGSKGARALMQLFFSLLWIEKRQKTKNRTETYLFIDEFQKAQIHAIPEIISEGRKYKFYLTLSNQQLGQLRDNIKNAILGNMGTLISFTVAADDIGAKTLAPFFGNEVSESDLSNLPPHIGYLRTEGDKQKPLVTFSFQTIPAGKNKEDKNVVDEMNNMSLEKYGEEIQAIEDRLYKKQSNPMKYFLEGIEK